MLVTSAWPGADYAPTTTDTPAPKYGEVDGWLRACGSEAAGAWLASRGLGDPEVLGVAAADPDAMPGHLRGWVRGRLRGHGPALLTRVPDPDCGPDIAGLYHLQSGAWAWLPGSRPQNRAVAGWNTLHVFDPKTRPEAVLVAETLPDALAADAVALEWSRNAGGASTQVLHAVTHWDLWGWASMLAGWKPRAVVLLPAVHAHDVVQRVRSMDRATTRLVGAGIAVVRVGWAQLMGMGVMPEACSGIGDWVAADGAPMVAEVLAEHLRGAHVRAA